MEQVLPSSINYLDTLPRAIPSEHKRRRFYATNGATFLPGSTIRIPLDSTREYLDPSNCYLNFTYENTTGQTCTFDLAGGHSFFENFRIQQKGNEICRVQYYNRLMNAIVVPCTATQEEQGDISLVGQTLYAGTAGAGTLNVPTPAGTATGADLTTGRHGSDADIAPGAEVKFNMPLVGGLFTQSGTAKLLPLPLLNAPIELYFDVAGVWSPIVSSGAAGDWILRDVYVVADLVEVPADVNNFMRELQMAHGGSLAIQGQGYDYNNGTIDAAATGSISLNVPSRKRSIKALYFAGSSRTYAGVGVGSADWATFYLSWSGNMCLRNYFVRAGSVVMPQPAVIAAGDNAVAGNNEYDRGEMLMELKKSMGHLGSHIGTGFLAASNYATNDSDNADGAGAQQSPVSRSGFLVSPYGLDMEAYQNEAIKAGLDTQTLSLEMQLVLEIEGGQAEPVQVDIFTLYDVQYYFNADGSITYED